MARTRFEELSLSQVAVTEYDEDGQHPIRTVYFCRDTREEGDRSYVKIWDGRYYPQVCEGLQRTGNTLTIYGETPLIDVIKREYFRQKRRERAETRRYA